MTLYVQDHLSQYVPRALRSEITRRTGCTWTSVANGIAAITGGRYHPSPDQVHGLLTSAEETNPGTPGWSIGDAVKACLKYGGIRLEDRTGDGWDAFIAALDAGHYAILQGDSDQFGNGSCSGAYEGDHCIGVHPKSKLEGGERWRWINDGICTTGRWERESVLRRYATKLWPRIRFGVFLQRVPAVLVKPPAKPVVLRFKARKLAKPVAKRIRVPKGRKANVRTAPRTNARVAARQANGTTFTACQVTDHGQLLAGSARWYGNRLGTRWVHSSGF